MTALKPAALSDELIDEMVIGCRMLRAPRAAYLDKRREAPVAEPSRQAREPAAEAQPSVPSVASTA